MLLILNINIMYCSEDLEKNFSENMAADEKDRFIQYLVDKVNTYELDKRATELAVEEFQSTFDSVSASLESLKKDMESLKAELREERSKRKKAEAKARKLEQKLKGEMIISNQSSSCALNWILTKDK